MKKVNKADVMRTAHIFWRRHKDNNIGLRFGDFLKRAWAIEKAKVAIEWDNYQDIPNGTYFCTYYNNGKVVFTVTCLAEIMLPVAEDDIQAYIEGCMDLNGTIKQIKFATDIRRHVLLILATALKNAKMQAKPGNERHANKIATMRDEITYMQSLTSAGEIIFRYKSFFYNWSENDIFAEPQRAYYNLCCTMSNLYKIWKTKQN